LRGICASGTYIRSLCEDIAVKLGTIGTMSKLTRTRIESFKLEDAYTIEQIRNKEFQFGKMSQALNYPVIEIDDVTDVKNGKKLVLDTDEKIVMLKHDDEILAIYEKDDEQQIYRCLRGLW
jgi:tRNA pseudouridine55 synthase